jgi:hypothetical protein
VSVGKSGDYDAAVFIAASTVFIFVSMSGIPSLTGNRVGVFVWATFAIIANWPSVRNGNLQVGSSRE